MVSFLPFHVARERKEESSESLKNEQTRPQSCSLGNWEGEKIGTGTTKSSKLVAADIHYQLE